MQRDAFVDLLMNRLGARTSSTLRDKIISEMVFVQENTLEGGDFLPWFLITNDDTLVSVASQEYINLPSDFIREWEDGGFWVNDSTDTVNPWKQLVRDDYDIIKKKSPPTTEDAPARYDRDGSRLLLRPIPDRVYSFDLWYYQQDSSLAGTYGDAGASEENGWLQHASDWMLGEVGLLVYSLHLQGTNQNIIQLFQALKVMGQDRVYKRDTEWREANKYRQMGDD